MVLVLLIIIPIYLFGFMLPLKIKLLKKHGKNLSNDEILRLAKEGDEIAIKLRRGARISIGMSVVYALVYVVTKRY